MIMFKLWVAILVTSISFLKSNVLFFLSTNLLRAIEARLQTATSSLLVNSTISVHKLLDLMVPRFF